MASTAPLPVALPVPSTDTGQAKSEGDVATSPSMFSTEDPDLVKYRDEILGYKKEYGKGWLVVLDQAYEKHTAVS